MNFPAGAVAIWPPLYDLALALPARVAHGAAATKEEVERGAAWVPVALAAGAIALAGVLGRRVRGAVAGAALALFVAVCPAHVLWTQYAHTDQHVAESLCGLAALVVFLASRARPEAAGQPSREIAAGLALAVAVLAWQGAIYWERSSRCRWCSRASRRAARWPAPRSARWASRPRSRAAPRSRSSAG
jgi:asparagine N-glycosylation enzyme membrane subunit Stt3